MGTKYSTVTVAGYNSAPPADDGSQVAANQVKWSTIKTKLPDPLKTAIESINSSLVTFTDFGSRQITSSDTSVAGDHMKTIEIGPLVSTSITVSLGDAATMAAGYIVTVKNSSPNSQTIGRATAGDKVDGVAQNITLPSKASLTFRVANTASEGYLTLEQFGAFLYDKTDPRKVIVQSAANVSSGSTRLVTWGNGDVTFQDRTGTVALIDEFAFANLAGSSGRLVYPPMWIQGLVPSAPTNSSIALSVGSARDVSDTANLILSSAITKLITATWVVGSGNGGLDTGTVTNASWYRVHLIKRSDTGVVDALFSLSATTPTLPASYDKFRWVGNARTDSAGTFIAFSSIEMGGGGLETLWLDPPLDVDAAIDTSAVSKALTIPTGAKVTALLNAVLTNAGSDAKAYISSLDVNNESASGTAAPLASILSTTAIILGGQVRVRTNTSSTVRIITAAAATTVRISTLGWEWSRR